MTTFEIGTQLVTLCQQGKNKEAIETLYSPDITSVEAMSMQGSPEVHGLKAVKDKNEWWYENHQVHSAEISGPFPNGDQFAVFFKYEVTPKMTGKKMKMEEVALYSVAHDKIIREEFFYKGM
jgi:hypothetical protein